MLLFTDRFEYGTAADLVSNWPLVTEPVLTKGRIGKGVLFGTYNSMGMIKPLGTHYQTLTCGLAVKYNEAFGNPLITFINYINAGSIDPETGLFIPGAYFWFNNIGDGRFFVKGEQGYIQKSSPIFGFAIHAKIWYYVELKVTMYATTMHYTVRINNNEVFVGVLSPFPIILTPYTNELQYVQIMGPGGGNTAILDDLYITTGEFYYSPAEQYVRVTQAFMEVMCKNSGRDLNYTDMAVPESINQELQSNFVY